MVPNGPHLRWKMSSYPVGDKKEKCMQLFRLLWWNMKIIIIRILLWLCKGKKDRWFVLKVFMRIKELDVVSKRQQEEEGEEINVSHLWLDVEDDYSVS